MESIFNVYVLGILLAAATVAIFARYVIRKVGEWQEEVYEEFSLHNQDVSTPATSEERKQYDGDARALVEVINTLNELVDHKLDSARVRFDDNDDIVVSELKSVWDAPENEVVLLYSVNREVVLGYRVGRSLRVIGECAAYTSRIENYLGYIRKPSYEPKVDKSK